MAAGRHNLSRRAVLGACFGAPVLLGGAATPDPFALSLSKGIPCASRPNGRSGLRQAQPERTGSGPTVNVRWTRALAAFRRAQARLAAFQQAEARLPPAARAFPACEPLEERFNDLECARLDALRRLLRAPAPDLPALARKIALTIDDQAWEFTGAGPCLAALKADARRLAYGG